MLFLNLEKSGHHVRVCFVLDNLTWKQYVIASR